MSSKTDRLEYFQVDYIEPHLERTKKILQAHPEIRQLFGNTPTTALWILAIVGLQIAVAVGLASADAPWWAILAAAYTVGALCDHALWALIHDASHNMVFKAQWPNKVIQIIANFPIFFPGSISFRHYHLIHHRHQGEPTLDADLVSDTEARVAGRGPIGKAIWFLLFPIWQPLRLRTLDVDFLDRWTAANILVQISFLAAMTAATGSWIPLVYFLLSGTFAVGLHPVGARWIQEHYILPEVADTTRQETYSYYGPMNRLAFNVGFHNEHHDVMMVPWSRLPQVKAMAPEFYDSLVSHQSWTRLLFRFLFDRRMTLRSRVIRHRKQGMRGKSAAAVGIAAANTETLAAHTS